MLQCTTLQVDINIVLILYRCYTSSYHYMLEYATDAHVMKVSARVEGNCITQVGKIILTGQLAQCVALNKTPVYEDV